MRVEGWKSGGLSNRWFCIGSGRRGGCSTAFFLSAFGVMAAGLLVFVWRGVFRRLIILCLCRCLLRGVSRPHSGVLPAIWGVHILFEKSHGFRKVWG
jgi:hypothetical protein